MVSAPLDPEDGHDNALVAALRAIPASGKGSFENLVRDLLSRETGQRFTLAKSGPQGGIDARTDAGGHANVMAVETKRYGAQTPLPADETRSKLDDAASAHPDLELWILAASREIREPDRSNLVAKGMALGIEVLILDWPDSAELLPGLLMLCAQHDDILRAYVTFTPEIKAVLASGCGHVSYDRQSADLHRQLCAPALGYGNARDALAHLVRDHMASLPAASARIGRYTNLTDPAIIRIDRAELRQAIAGWWDGTKTRPPLALLGSEGMGKTWAALSWWLDRELAGTPLPLTLIVPARFIASASPDEILGSALFQMFGIRDAAWWARRARRWCAAATATRIVLIVDGLNERFDAADWATLASELMLAPWVGAVDLVMTDRNDHWRRVLGGFQGAGIGCTEVSVGPFSDSELHQVLGRAGMKRDRLDSALVPLMKVPRLCALALRHWQRLSGSGDITPERLVYEDFRDRIYPSLDDQEMRNLIAEIGANVRSAASPDITVLRREIGETLAVESGIASSEATISAIVSGVWFAPIPGEPNRFRVNPDLAPIAMGLALARAVQSLDTAEAVGHRIEAFVDDLRGLQLGVTVIGIAASFATIAPECSEVARRVLLDTWLGSDNFYGNELKRYTRLITEDPAYFLDRTERVWRDREQLHDDRNVHLAGMVNAAEVYPTVMAAFTARATLWLSESFGWRDVVNDAEPEAEIAGPAVAQRVIAWNAVRGDLPPLILIEPDDDYLSVADTLLYAISYLPRAPFAEALATYAVVVEVTREMHYRRDRFEWLLRANCEDAPAAEQSIIAEASRLRAVADPHAGAAADRLLAALASLDPSAQPYGERLPRRFGRESSVKATADGIWLWTYSPPDRKPGWGEIALRNATDLADAATDPEARLSGEAEAMLRGAAQDMIATDGNRRSDMAGPLRSVLARWVPDLLNYYLARTADIDTGRYDINSIIAGWSACWVAHDEAVTNGIASIFRSTLRVPPAQGSNRRAAINASIAALALAEATSAEQLAAFRAMPHGPTWLKSSSDFLKAFSAEDFATLAPVLNPAAQPRLLALWLSLLAHGDLSDMPAGYPSVAVLLRHDSAEVRTAAMRVAQHAPDNALSNILRDGGWTAGDATGDEAVQGSAALARADPITGDNRPRDIAPLLLGYLAREWPDEGRYVEAFANHVRDRVRSELDPPRQSVGFAHSVDDRRSFDRLVAERSTEIEAWLAPVIARGRVDLGHMLFSSDRAIIELCRALLRVGNPAGAAVWRALIASMNDSSVKSDDLRFMIFDLPLNSVTEPLRIEAMGMMHLDQQLFEVASSLRRQGAQSQLVDIIGAMLDRSTYDCARALVLAGELDSDAATEVLWNDRILSAALPRWLEQVRRAARARYEASKRAKYWLTRFVDEEDPVVKFGAFELFMATASRACARWATRTMDAARIRISRRTYDHWRINVPRINARLKEDSNSGKDSLTFTRVPKHDQAPWH
jgi:hypothetical protein|tara:strand:+ start:1701 stop:6119 length:4419 start_codon:yes stop_codon:yes gene_type:complete